MYIRKEIREFMEKMPKDMKMPRHWKKFVNKYDKEYNLLIQHGNTYECTNCGKYSYEKILNNTQHPHSSICPFCGKKFDIKRSNLKNYFFLYDLAAVDNVDNKLIIRYFEVLRRYDYRKRRFDDNIVEYARIVPEFNIELVNDRYFKCLTAEHISHYAKIKKWRVFTGKYGLNQYYEAVYLDDITEKLKGTIFEYAPLVDAILYLGNHRTDFLKVIQKAKYSSFELLMKAGLYKLALDCPERFNERGSFEKRFGVNKKFYYFMKRHDISYDELRVLQITQRPNMGKIRRLLKISFSNVDRLLEASMYTNLIKLEEYSKKQISFTIPSYLDYIKNMIKLEIPLTKKILFPVNFIEAHNLSVEKVKIVNNKILKEKIKKRYKQLEKNKYSNNIFL